MLHPGRSAYPSREIIETEKDFFNDKSSAVFYFPTTFANLSLPLLTNLTGTLPLRI